MRKSLLPEKYHTYVYIFALILLVIGMPLSKFLMSLSQIILACNFILEGDLKNKFTRFFKNKAALILSSLFLLHVLGLLYTSDFDYAWNDIRIKIPLIVLPLIFSASKPLSATTVKMILYFFVAAIVAGTLISIMILTGVIHREVVDIRSVSIFISHIRFGLLICVAVFVSGYFLFQATASISKVLWLSIGCWLIIFLVITESMTGLSAFCFAALVIAILKVIKSDRKVVRYSGVLLVAGIGVFIFYIVNQVAGFRQEPDYVEFWKLEEKTPRGNQYLHDRHAKLTENGHYIWIYVSDEEVEECWNKRSSIKFNELDLKGNPIRYTIFRFMTSKGLRKDADGMEKISDDEIKAIERGMVNVNYQNISSLKRRLHEIAWELDMYKVTGDPSGHSLTQRFEFWKAALGIIKSNPVIGVGTGDVKIAFEQQYDKMNSPLAKESRLRSHNQYLSIGVAFGMVGLIWFLVTLIWPMLIERKAGDYLYLTFLLIAMISFFTEDTLETQAGVTFYAFLNSFFLFIFKKQE